MEIKVLGTGCAKCKTTVQLIEQMAKEAGANVTVEKVEDIVQIMQYGVMTTPGVVIDDKVVHAGGVPAKEAITDWLAGAAVAVSGGDSNSGGCCGTDTSETKI